MSQATDFTLANQPGASFRNELNTIVQALASTNSGSTEPPLRYPGMLWADTSVAPPILKIRNVANTAWLTIDPTAFGIGVTDEAALTSADAITESGFRRTSAAATGAPLAGESFRYIHLPGPSTAAASQIAIGETSGRMFVRRRSGGAWVAWDEINLGSITTAMFAAAALRTSGEGFASLLDTEVPSAAWVKAYFESNPWGYTSTTQTITNGTLLTLAHGLGARPTEVRLVARCTTAQSPYVVGEEVEMLSSTAGSEVGGLISADATNLYIRTASAGLILWTNAGIGLTATNSSWRYIARARL